MNYYYCKNLKTPLLLFLFTGFYVHTLSTSCKAQNLKGIWTGYLRSDTSGIPILNTDYVLHVKDQNDNTISGKAYVLEKRFDFEGILDFIGVINKGRLKLTELRILSSRVPVDTKLLCIKLLDLDFTSTDSVDYLKGHWTGTLEDRTPCIPGMAYLTRHKPGVKIKIPEQILQKIASDPGPAIFLNTRLSKPTIVEVRNRVLQLELNDYLREDEDTVSVYINRRLFIRRQKIEKKSAYKILRIDPNAGLNEIIMYAENLGKIPPNTSVLTIDDGYRKQRVRIESTKDISAVIYLRYQPPNRVDPLN